jgi:hypothetical protein
MLTYHMNQISWSQFGVSVPDLSRPISMRHLETMSESDEQVSGKGTRSVLLVNSRTKEPICRIIIDETSEKGFQSLQNELLISRL